MCVWYQPTGAVMLLKLCMFGRRGVGGRVNQLLARGFSLGDSGTVWTRSDGDHSHKPDADKKSDRKSHGRSSRHVHPKGHHPKKEETPENQNEDEPIEKKIFDQDFSKSSIFNNRKKKGDRGSDSGGHHGPSGTPEEQEEKRKDSLIMKTALFFTSGLVLLVYSHDVFAETNVHQMTYKDFLTHLDQRSVQSIDIVTDYHQIKSEQKIIVRTKATHGANHSGHGATPNTMFDRATNQVATRKAHPSTVSELQVLDPTNFLANLEREMKNLRYETKDYIPVRFVNSYKTKSVFWKITKDSVVIAAAAAILFALKDMKGVLDKLMPGMSKQIKSFEVKKLKGGFDSVAGLDNAKLEIQEFVDFLKNPFVYGSIGARMPKGALLTGPPGTGKTLLAKACAVESGVSFFAVSGSDFVEKYVGIGSFNVRRLFKEAKAHAPAVIFIDEIDAIGKKRSESAVFANTERENTLNQLLVELDGFDSKTSVVVLAATNRPETLDPALLRPGRLDRHIALTLPDIKSRESIFRLYLSKLKIDQDKLDILAKRLASLSPQFSGADIANLCNEAAILAAREFAEHIEVRHFEEAAERVIGGLRRDNLISKDERKLVATHESGHAVASWFLKGADPLVKVTIVPRTKGALGYAQYLTEDDDIYTKSALMDRITFIFGGRVAEELFFNKISTGAQDDLEKAFKLAHTLVTKLGMSEEFAYSNFSVDEKQNQYMAVKENTLFSDATQEKIDSEITKIIEECYNRCREILTEKKHLVEKLRDTLLEKESVTLDDLNAILGERQSGPIPDFGFRL